MPSTRRAIDAYPPAAADTAITSRLHHIHTVQRAFLWAVGDRRAPFSVSTSGEFPTLAALKVYARGSLDAFDRFVDRRAPWTCASMNRW